MTLFFSLSAFAGPYDEYGYNNSSFGSPMYNTGAMGGGTYWSQLAADFYTQSNAVTPYSYSQTIETKVKTSNLYTISNKEVAATPTTIVVKVDDSRGTGYSLWWIYPATTITSTQEKTVNIAQANTTVLSTYGPNTYFNFNVYNPAQQNYAYNTYQATSTGPVLVASATQSGPPPMSVQYTAIPRSVSTGPVDSSLGSKFQTAIALYNQQTLTLSEANNVIVDFIDRVIPDAPNGRVQYIGNVIDKVKAGLPPDQNGQAANLLVMYSTGKLVTLDADLTTLNTIDPKQKANFRNVSTVSNTLENKKWIPYSNNCNTCAREQNAQSSLPNTTPVEAGMQANTFIDKTRQAQSGIATPEINMQKAIDIVTANLKVGKPVMAGVMYERDYGADRLLGGTSTDNNNVATNHYVTIVGMGIDNGYPYFSYYDNFVDGHFENGNTRTYNTMELIATDVLQNRFYYYKDSAGNYYFSDTTAVTIDGPPPPLGHGSGNQYILTEIRDNK